MAHDMVGQTFGRLKVIALAGSRKTGNGGLVWLCVCTCGNETVVRGDQLRSGQTRSCGCKGHSTLVGQQFGRLTVIGDTGEKTEHRERLWQCRCSCGSEIIIKTGHLQSGAVRSCGCLRKETTRATANKNIQHGHTTGHKPSSEYRSFTGMHQRCNNPKDDHYENYGGRGIAVCERWHSFENFLADMGLKPTPRHTIDRYPNNDGNYEPGNCRWATAKEQRHNRRDSRHG